MKREYPSTLCYVLLQMKQMADREINRDEHTDEWNPEKYNTNLIEIVEILCKENEPKDLDGCTTIFLLN